MDCSYDNFSWRLLKIQKTKISVCIPVRNSEQVLPNCFRCLKAQTIQPLEYVICTGKSEDRTEEIVKEFQNYSEVPVNIVYDNEGIGTGYARNLLVETAKGDYVVWIDSDHVLPINWLEALKRLTEIYSDIDTITSLSVTHISKKQSLDMWGKKSFPKKVNIDSLNINSGLIRDGDIVKRNTILKAGGFDSFFVRGQDIDLIVRLKAMGASGIWCKELKHLHVGHIGEYRKAFKRSVVPKLIYKYGLRCIKYVRINFLESMLRLSVFFSLLLIVPLHLLGLTIFGSIWTALSLLSLFIGTTLKHGFNLGMYVIQMIKCLAEIYLWFKILTDTSKKRYGYGKDALRTKK